MKQNQDTKDDFQQSHSPCESNIKISKTPSKNRLKSKTRSRKKDTKTKNNDSNICDTKNETQLLLPKVKQERGEST